MYIHQKHRFLFYSFASTLIRAHAITWPCYCVRCSGDQDSNSQPIFETHMKHENAHM